MTAKGESAPGEIRVWKVTVRGRGRVEVPAYGVADAEHQVEKELGRLWSPLRVSIASVARTGDPRIVEEFRVDYGVVAEVAVREPSLEKAHGEAIRTLRAAFTGSRFERVEWLPAPGAAAPSSPR